MTSPNILLFLLDATRADHCGCYGTSPAATPALDALAAKGTLFENAMSSAPWTLPAVSSMLTGRPPGQLGVYATRRLDATYPTLPSLLGKAGYATYGITNNSWLSADFGLQRGFQAFHKQWQLFQIDKDVNHLVLTQTGAKQRWFQTVAAHFATQAPVRNTANAVFNRMMNRYTDLGAARLFRPINRWLQQTNAPWFALVHLLEAHLPFRLPRAWVNRYVTDRANARRLMRVDQSRLMFRHMTGVEPLSDADLQTWRELYAASVAYGDHQFGRLLDQLRESGHLNNTAVIVVADHGESLGEHTLLGHQYGLYETLVHVPLVIYFPDRVAQGKRVPHPVTTTDIFDTILDLAGLDAAGTERHSLLSGTPAPFIVAEYGTPRPPVKQVLDAYDLTVDQLQPFARGCRALRTERHKLIAWTDGQRELYDIRSDPGETQNLASAQPQLAERLHTTLTEWVKTHNSQLDAEQDAEAMSAAVRDRLQALGYVD